MLDEELRPCRDEPVLLVIAGPNGSGKTTVTVRLRVDRRSEGVEYLNPDDVARDRFGDWNSPEATLEAARWTTARREALLAAHQGIAFETVFSADDKLDFVARARARGVLRAVFFIGTSDPRINAARVAGRVMAGGHTVPAVRQRVPRSHARRAWEKCCHRAATRFDQFVQTGRARWASRGAGGYMRNTLSMVLLGIGLLSPGCSKARMAAPAGGLMADRVEPEATRGSVEDPREATAGGAAGSSSAAAPGGVAAARPAAMAAEPAPAANVRAGEWDDNANYRDYVRWLQETPRGIARLDASGRQFVVVEDSAGKPVPNCKLTITGGTHTASLVTMASGRALLFPHALGLDGPTLAAVATCGQATAQATIHTDELDGIAELRLPTERELPARRTIDLAFVLDTTGSMGEEIDAVKSTIRTVAAKLGAEQTDVRIGLVEYKDRGDPEVTHTYPFSSDLPAFSRSVAGISAGGGGDMPEDMQAGLAAALDKLQWRPDATARLIVVIADAPPHLDYQDERDYADATRRAAARGIKMFTVSASGMDDTGQIVMRQMAQFTGASNMFVLRGGAGPQSVGGGDPKSSCGGTQEQYASGNLDQLIVSKVRRELASLDADPLRIAGRGKDENAKPCNQRIVMAN